MENRWPRFPGFSAGGVAKTFRFCACSEVGVVILCPMPQVQLPIFPQGTSHINPELAFKREAEQIVYYNGHLPVFTHAASAANTFFTYRRVGSIRACLNGLPSSAAGRSPPARSMHFRTRLKPLECTPLLASPSTTSPG